MNAIKINNLTKSYNKHLVLENIDLEISNDKYNSNIYFDNNTIAAFCQEF